MPYRGNIRPATLTGILGVLAFGQPAIAQVTIDGDGLRGDFGAIQVRGNVELSIQGAAIDPVGPPPAAPNRVDRVGSAVDASARVSIEYISDNAWVFGLAADVDTGNVDIANFERDELYLYVAADWGRIEFGENDGPADTLSFHAPQVGLGQVRGDFARYSGSVALLSVYDTRDAAKITYLSSPSDGFRFGISYSPEFSINEQDPIPTRRLIQNDVIELGAQYIAPVGDWVVGISGAYVSGTSDPATGRGDLKSWGAGLELRRDKLVFGAAYLDRDQSNLSRLAPAESEWNAGLSWQEAEWSVAASVAVSDEAEGTVSRFGVGGEFDVTENVFVRADVVAIETELVSGSTRDGTVGVMEIGLRF